MSFCSLLANLLSYETRESYENFLLRFNGTLDSKSFASSCYFFFMNDRIKRKIFVKKRREENNVKET